MKDIISEMLEKKNWAVVGAHPNPERFGYKIFKKLCDNNYNVAAINPMYEKVKDSDTFDSIKDVKTEIDCVSVVVSPKLAWRVVEQTIESKIKYIWFQPGSFNNDIITFAKENGLNVVYNACVLLEL